MDGTGMEIKRFSPESDRMIQDENGAYIEYIDFLHTVDRLRRIIELSSKLLYGTMTTEDQEDLKKYMS